MKKVLSLLLSFILLMASVPVGTISAEALEYDVIEIRTIAELYNINSNMSGNYKLMNDIDMTEDTAVGGDWDFMGNGWEPIGSNGVYGNTAFTGTFDGGGHMIIGMRIVVNNKPSGTGTVYLGLFANNSGTIKNLGIDETSVVQNGFFQAAFVPITAALYRIVIIKLKFHRIDILVVFSEVLQRVILLIAITQEIFHQAIYQAVSADF